MTMHTHYLTGEIESVVLTVSTVVPLGSLKGAYFKVPTILTSLISGGNYPKEIFYHRTNHLNQFLFL